MNRPTPHELRVMAAAIEAPDDLTAEELQDAHEDIVAALLYFADEQDGGPEKDT